MQPADNRSQRNVPIHPAVEELRDMVSPRGERWWAVYRALQAIEACATADELLVGYYLGIERNLKPPTMTGARRPGPLVCAFRFSSMSACWRKGSPVQVDRLLHADDDDAASLLEEEADRAKANVQAVLVALREAKVGGDRAAVRMLRAELQEHRGRIERLLEAMNRQPED